ncbi:MAG: NAD(P)/FAD-dependent oxidoreductase, partial [Candidatus Wildermuthbacteria bacterium]|nr:NAD(P)/FAD-dependent oxidoreductase [Candidatus Wildermuthbacteria bacterium]
MKYDLIVIGSGAAGLAAALYARRYQMTTLVIAGEFGGETSTAGKIENYPGIITIDGGDLMLTMRKQAELVGAKIFEEKAQSVEKKEGSFVVKTEKETFEGRTVILAIGARRRHLGLPNEEELTSKGVHYCVTCDG